MALLRIPPQWKMMGLLDDPSRNDIRAV